MCCLRKKMVTVNDFHLRQEIPIMAGEVQQLEVNHAQIKAVLPSASRELVQVPTFNIMKTNAEWITAITKEFSNLLDRKVLIESDIQLSQVKDNAKNILVPLKWVMVYNNLKPKARLVLRRDFLKNQYEDATKYSPTINLEKVRTGIVTLIRNQYNFTISNVNQAFTLGSTSDYEIEAYSKLPALYEINPGKSDYKTHTNKKGQTTKLLKLSKNLWPPFGWYNILQIFG